MDKGMKKSALCETGHVPGAAEVIESPEDCMTLKNAVTKGVKAWRDRPKDGRILPTDFGGFG